MILSLVYEDKRFGVTSRLYGRGPFIFLETITLPYYKSYLIISSIIFKWFIFYYLHEQVRISITKYKPALN